MIGRKLRQRYQIIQKLGAGGFGETYLAEDLDIPVTPKLKCVVKQLKPKVIAPDIPQIPLEDIVRLFEKEGQTLYELGQNHDQIPKLYAYFEQNRKLYLVQEFIDGHDLSQEITTGKQWSEAQVIPFLKEILEVLAFVHQHNVIHRDIKPSNIMRRKCDCKLILIDFGIVKLANVSGAVSSTIPIGTPGYAPIEQARGQPRFSSDIYALGMTAIQALTGIDNPSKLPVDNNGDVVWRDRVQVSDWRADILTKMVRYDFRQRYVDATEALQALTLTRATSPPPFASPLLPVKVDHKWGYIDKTGQVVIQPQFDEANLFSEGLTAVRIGSKWGYINQTGEVIIQPQFDSPGEFYEGLLAVEIGDKWGYIDKTGQVVIQPQFDSADEFSEGLAAVRISDKRGYIDKRGEEVIPAQFDEAWQFSEGLAKIKIDDKWGYIDKTGQVIIQPQFTEIARFTEGLASIKIDNKFGYIDKTGRVVIQPQFNFAFSFREGLAVVRSNNKFGYINPRGEVVIQPQFDIAIGFAEGLAVVKIGEEWGYLNPRGEVVIQPQFDDAGDFVEGLAVVKIGKQYGYIDQTGKVIIQPLFDRAVDFSEGIARVRLGKDWRYIDKTGNFIY
ncbi:WG repeat-containing protein [Trichocoleus sp. ST-U3]